MKIWTCGSSPRSGSRNAWTRIKTVNGACRLSNFWNFFGAIQMISCRDWWPWTKPGYITMTRRQSNNRWRGDIAAHPAPKNSECEKPLEKFSPRIFGIKTDTSSLIIFQRAKLSTPHWLSSQGPNYQRRVFSSLLVQLKDILKEKHSGKVTKVVLFLHDNTLAYRALATRKKLAYLGFQCLDHPPYSPDLARRTTTYSLYWKNKGKFAIFCPARRSLLARRPGWTDDILIFFLSGLQKLEQRAKKCTELRGEYGE